MNPFASELPLVFFLLPKLVIHLHTRLIQVYVLTLGKILTSLPYDFLSQVFV